MITAEDVDEAALALAVAARELLGLPIERHVTAAAAGGGKHAPPFIAYAPPLLHEAPSALDFARRLASPSPCIIQKALQDRPRVQQWKQPGYLTSTMGDRLVKVAVTPDGRADDLKELPDGKTVFALPAETHMTLAELSESMHAPPSPSRPILYLQSQDSNLTDESAGDLQPLLRDLADSKGRHDPEWATEAIGSDPEAVNVWIGSTRSKSSMHRDHYENLFYTVRGKKIFTVFPPTEAHFLCEGEPFEVYRHDSTEPYSLRPDPDTPPTPWIPVDPTEGADSTRNRPHTRYAKGLKPLRIEVKEDEMLYLPAGWYHHVSQESDSRSEVQGRPGGLCVAINWWYESQAAFGPQWAMLDFIKAMGDRCR